MNLDWRLLALAAVGVYLWQHHGQASATPATPGIPASQPTGGTPPAGPGGTSISDYQAALVVARRRPDICQFLTSESRGQWSCGSEKATADSIAHWFYDIHPKPEDHYVSLVELVMSQGWS